MDRITPGNLPARQRASNPLWEAGLPARLLFEQADYIRQLQGALLACAGSAPRQTPCRILHEQAGFRLRGYGGRSQRGAALLIVPAPIKRFYIWDLEPHASVVRRCLQQDMRVYLVEWLDPDRVGQHFGLADYADGFLEACFHAIESDSGQAQAILTGHSLGGTLAAIFACLHPQRVRALVLLEAPLHFGEDAGCFAPLVAAAPDARLLGQAFGNVPGSFLSLVASLAAPVDFQWQRHADLLLSAIDERKLATHLRVERWALDEFPLAGRLFADIIELLYRFDHFMQGRLRIDGRQVGPRDLTVPLLSVADPHSGAIPPQSIVPFQQAAAALSKKLLAYEGDVGVAIRHVGVLVGENAHARLWPAIFEWLAATAAC